MLHLADLTRNRLAGWTILVVKEEPTRTVVKRLKAAGFARISTDGSHSRWAHPNGAWVAVPDSHRTISPGVVRKVNQAIEQASEA